LDFQKYLLAKKSVDDQALNRNVFDIFSEFVSNGKRQSILEIGGGIGTMVQRLAAWLPKYDLDYTLMDIDPANINAAKVVVSQITSGFTNNSQTGLQGKAAISGEKKQLRMNFLTTDVYDLSSSEGSIWDGIVANAFFDLVELDSVLPILNKLLRPGGWIYATINFDGHTVFEPVINDMLDIKIIDAYHSSMDKRRFNGKLSIGSQSGRKLFKAFQNHGFEIRAVGSSDWVVFPRQNEYFANERYFLEVILSFLKESITPSDLISQQQLNDWLEIRKNQLDNGELLFVAHQLDYFVIKQ
jgi:SAM-dependent methyltransferase